MTLRAVAAAVAILALAIVLARRGPSTYIRTFPAGVTLVHEEITVQSDSEIRGVPGRTLLKAASDFRGRALLVVAGDRVRISDLIVDGNRAALEVRAGLPRYDQPFARFTVNNGIFAEGVTGLNIQDVQFREVAGFAVLVSRARQVAIERLRVESSGSRNAAGRNNTTGGILLEEGTSDFRVANCELSDVRGNGVWTHSLYTSPRNARGVFAGNRFSRIGRDALQAGHVTEIRIEGNHGSEIGFPPEMVDAENQAIPVAVDTAGNVDGSVYQGNVFHEINGKCVDLDGFHDGSVRDNVCVNSGPPERYPWGGYAIVMNNSNPDMQSQYVTIENNYVSGAKFGGVFIIGRHNTVTSNQLLNLNIAHCNEEAVRFGCYYPPGQPDLLTAGIYLGSGAERPAPARDNVVERNTISGWKMSSRCIAFAPTIRPEWNRVRFNNCR